MSIRRFVYLWLVLGIPAAYGQPAEVSVGTTIVNDALVTFHDGIAYFTTPFRIDRQDALNLFKFGMATTATLAADREAAHAVRSISPTKALDAVMDVGHAYGETKLALILPAGVYLGGLVSGNDDIRVTGRQLFQALLYSSAVTQSMKWLIGRSRPDAGDDPFQARLHRFNEPIDDRMYSMPSGHATVAFAISSVLAQRINNTYASIALYGLASTTAISRLYHNRHWFSDVFVAAVIGTATGVFVTTRDEVSGAEQSQPLKIMPTLTGVQLEYKF